MTGATALAVVSGVSGGVVAPLVVPLVAGTAVAVAVLLLRPGTRRRLPGGRRDVGAGPGRRALLAVPLLGIALVDHPRWVVVALVLAGVVEGGRRILARRRLLAEAAATRARVVEACTSIAAELGVGATPTEALARAAEEWPLLGPASRIGHGGGSVADALRVAAATPGAADLRTVAAAWQIAHRTGHGLADTLDRIAADLRAAERTRRVVTGELASARATARLVAVLPVAALAMGSGAGASPVGFLLTDNLGLLCLVGGMACGLAGLAWIEAIAAGVERAR